MSERKLLLRNLQTDLPVHRESDLTGHDVTTAAEQYRVKAKQCAEWAELARDPETKRQYEDLARRWLDLARRAEGDRR